MKLPYTYAEPEDVRTITMMSRCHEHKGTWVPEIGSPRHGRIQRHYREYKFHWRGSDRCVYVVGVLSHRAEDRVLTGDEFDRCTKDEVCANCRYEFENA